MNVKTKICNVQSWIIRRTKIRSVQSWIIILLILLVVVNIIAFYIYHISHPSEILSMQAWRYLESSTFKILNASIILPSLLFLLEVLFKIGAKRKEEHEERQWECIEKTSQMWNQLFSLASEVRYFEKDANKGARIEDILLKLAKFVGPAEDVVNMWGFRFFRNIPEKDIWFLLSIDTKFEEELNNGILSEELKKEIEKNGFSLTDNAAVTITGEKKFIIRKEEGKLNIYDIGYLSKDDIINLFLLPLNVLLRSTLAVAYFIRDANKEDKKEILWLQSSLEQIQGCIKDRMHMPLIDILKKFMYMEESDEKAMKDIKKDIKELKDFNDWLRNMEKNNKLFSYVEGDEVEEFRKAVEMMKSGEAGKESGNLKGLFLEIPPEERPRLTAVRFSTDYVKHLADEMNYYRAISISE